MNKFVFISILFIIILLFLSIERIEHFEECNYKHLVLSDKKLKETKDLIVKYLEITEKFGIKSFATAGTLIGCVRNGGLMPHDDDIDMGIFKKDVKYIESYRDDEYYFSPIIFGYKFKKKNSYMFIDIFVFEDSGDTYKIINNQWKNEFAYKDEVFPLKKMKYGDMYIYVFSNYKKYLDRVFKDWDKKIVL